MSETEPGIPEVLPGEYWQDKQQADSYSVYGTARPYAGQAVAMSFWVVHSGTENANPEKILRIHYLQGGGLAYENEEEDEFTGMLVVYVPNYGKYRLTFRTIEDFAAEVPGRGRRFRPAEKGAG